MKLTLTEDPHAFQERAFSFLLQNEVENNLMIGLLQRLIADKHDAADPPYYCVVEDAGRVVAAAMRTPPHNLIVPRCPPPVLEFLARELHARGLPLPGVIGPSEAADCFAGAWCAVAGVESRLQMAERIYRLDQVSWPPPVSGRFGVAQRQDAELAIEWARAFNEEALGSIDDVRPMVERRLDEGALFFWRDARPVSMAGAARSTPHGTAVAPVYTPPELRRRGYASAVVAALSQRILDGGKQFCCLFTDLSNPTSNSIYQKIGYRPVSDVNMLAFIEAPEKRPADE